MEKKCTRCGEIKDVSEFNKCSKAKDGLDYWCRKCKKDFYKDPINKERKAKSDKAYAERNKEKIKQYKKDWQKNNKDRLRERYQKWYNDNRKAIYQKAVDKRKNSNQARLSHTLRTRINKGLHGMLKEEKTFNLIGCTIDELIKHIESLFVDGMSWDNYGKNGWHIDHIIPVASFDLTKLEEQKKCFNYKNLQPLWAEDNYRKGDRISS